MIRDEKYLNALHCFFHILKEAKYFAIEHREYKIQELLNVAERMPYLIGAKADHTDELRQLIEEVAGKNPNWNYILAVFDAKPPEW